VAASIARKTRRELRKKTGRRRTRRKREGEGGTEKRRRRWKETRGDANLIVDTAVS